MKLYELYFYLIRNNKNVSDFDIRYLISFFQQKNFYFDLNNNVKNVTKIKKLFQLLKKNVPLAYLINETFFLGNKYFVDKNVLIPRTETEELVLLAIKNIEIFLHNLINSHKKIRVLDVGTGSGVIAIELKKKFPFCEVIATDISKKILKVAKKNAKKNNVDIVFNCTDVFPKKNNNYDIIISNPPYIKYKKDVQKSVLKHEPHTSLFVSKKNNVYEKIFRKLNQVNNLSLVMFEITENIIPMLNKLMKQFLCNKNYNFMYSNDINKKRRFLSLFFYQ